MAPSVPTSSASPVAAVAKKPTHAKKQAPPAKVQPAKGPSHPKMYQDPQTMHDVIENRSIRSKDWKGQQQAKEGMMPAPGAQGKLVDMIV